MNKKLKFFLTSFVGTFILAFILLGILFDLSGWDAVAWIMILPFIITITLIIFIIISAIKTKKGERVKFALIVAGGFILAFGLVYGGFILNEIHKDYEFEKNHEKAKIMINTAVNENNINKCFGVNFVDYGWPGCYLWVAYENNDYSICEKLPEDSYAYVNKKGCWLMALIKTKDKSYCDNFIQEDDKEECLNIYSKFSNQTFIDNYNPLDPKFKSGCTDGRASSPERCDYEYEYYVKYSDKYL